MIENWSRRSRGLFRIVATGVMTFSAFGLHAFDVKDIQPPHWWAGMKDHSLQLQIHGADIRPAEVKIDYPGVSLDSVVRLDGSADWQYLYLTISPDARPGKFRIEWREGKKKLSREYELRARKPQKGAQGFSAADVLYMVMPDRFSDGDIRNNNSKALRNQVGADRTNPNTRHGGDLRGLINHAAYIDSLGMTALWVAPVLENDMPGGSYHGYATTDYYKVDPRFGTNAEYIELIDTLHGRGIKTVMDMIFNHSGSSHPWMAAPPASDWFNNQGNYKQTNYRLSTITDPYASQYDRSMTQDGWFVRDMPDLNQKNPHLMKYLIQNSIWWIEEAQIDGIRMDTYPYADEKQMARWIDEVKAEYPDFNIVGECWFGETAGEAFWQKGSPLAASKGEDTRLPVVMDFPLMIKSRGMAPYFEDTDPWNGLNKIYDHIALDYVYPDPMKVLRFLDNHDTERVLLQVPDSLSQWKQAMTILLTMPGIPQVYYGTEILMHGTREGGDGNVRKDMPGGFPGDTTTVFTREGRSDLENEAVDYISALNRFRKGSKAIAEGGMKHFMPDNGIYLYQRGSGDESVVVMMNGRDKENKVDMARYAEIIPEGARYKDVITGEEVVIRPESGNYDFAPRETRVLVPLK
ncbi:MAG: glycoside hydrolase family 13 protein [Muribaculaceae bacterium]|nr:glycoside hydrolase family 13 protein [Muribaculaceae bacterium]